MGILDLFKRKTVTFERVCPHEGPEHLVGFTKDIDDDIMKAFGTLETEQLWTRQVKSQLGATDFKIKFFGERIKNTIEGSKFPALIVASSPDTGEQVVLFDGALHGSHSQHELPEGTEKRKAGQAMVCYTETLFKAVVSVSYEGEKVKDQTISIIDRTGRRIDIFQSELF